MKHDPLDHCLTAAQLIDKLKTLPPNCLTNIDRVARASNGQIEVELSLFRQELHQRAADLEAEIARLQKLAHNMEREASGRTRTLNKMREKFGRLKRLPCRALNLP